MKPAPPVVSISVLGKEYSIGCAPEERDTLIEAARYLDQKMRQIHDSNRVLGMERSAVMAALNISAELMELRRQPPTESPEIGRRLEAMRGKIDVALSDALELGL